MTTRRMRLRTLDELRIEDERAFRAIDHFALLKEALRRDGYRFRCLQGASAGRWDRALLLNLAFWGGEGDVLVGESIPADVVAHVAWHHVARRALAFRQLDRSADGLLFGEAIASAYDLYWIGRLLPGRTTSSLLRSQVVALAEAAQAAGLSAAGFARLLGRVADDPPRAFGELRALLFQVATALLAARSAEQALAALAAHDAHPFAPLLHHYELSTWILYARAYLPEALDPVPEIRALDVMLRRSKNPLSWLLTNWGTNTWPTT